MRMKAKVYILNNLPKDNYSWHSKRIAVTITTSKMY